MLQPADLKLHFETVAERMAELPVFNAELAVDVVGFQAYGADQIGVLVTPWCMNLVRLINGNGDAEESGDSESKTTLQPGEKQMLGLPSGSYEFIQAEIDGLGSYQSCSLFSPMFEFADQNTALETAEIIMRELFDRENYAPTDRQQALKAQCEEEIKQSEAAKAQEQKRQQRLEGEVQEKQISRRGFLTAGFACEDRQGG